MILKTRPISKNMLDKLTRFTKLTHGVCLKDMLSANETFRRLADGIKSDQWKAQIITIMESRRCDTRPLADDNPETKYVATIEVDEEFTLYIDGRNFGKHATPRLFVNAILDYCGLFPTPLY
jgi:hypothetical protein